MPNITVELVNTRTVEQYAAFAKAVTDAAVDILGAERSTTRIRFLPVGDNQVALGGELVRVHEVPLTP